MSPDDRWKLRFTNFQKAFGLLKEALADGPSVLSMLEKEGVVQRFEYTLELAWKTLKDFLESQGAVITPLTPKQVLKEAFAAGILTDGQVWIEMIERRNLLSHTYNSALLETVIEAVAARYLPAFENLTARLSDKP